MSNKSDTDTLYKIMRILIHTVGFIQFSYGVYYDWTYVKIPIEIRSIGLTFGGKFKFLTFWDSIVQALYFAIALLNDVAGSNEVTNKEGPTIRKIKDYLLAAIAFPIAMFVGVTFWSLMAIDRELVFPKALDAFFPSWLNHVMHTNIMMFTVLEMITSFRVYPRRSKGLGGLTIFMAVYLAWTHVIYYNSGQWVYPVLEVLNLWQRTVFFLALLLFSSLLYLAGEFLNNYIWEKELKQIHSHSGRQGRRKNK